MKQTQHKFLKWTLPIFLVVFSMSVSAQTDVTDTHLTNAGFDSNPNVDVNATSNLGTATDGSTVQTVDGWSASGADWRAGATFEYGTSATLNGQGVPSTASDGSTTGAGHAALGISVAWGGSLTYFQNVTLPAGTYSLTYKAYNSHAGVTGGSSLAGWVPDAGSSTLSSLSSFPDGVWTTDVITFVVTEETSGKIQVGVNNSGSGGSGANARVFIDDILLEYTAVILSEDATLSNLTASVGTLSPAFAPGTYEYFLEVPVATSSVNLIATKNDDAANVSGGGTISLSGNQKVEDILVTAEAGNTLNYRVKIWYEGDILFNQTFDLEPNYDVSSSDNLAPSNNGSANLAVVGWDLATFEYSTSGTFEYGTSATMNGKAVPSTASDGSTTGAGHAALGIMSSWSANIRYSQQVTLPAGSYKLSYKAYNANTSGAVGNSLAGWIPDAGTAVMSTVSGGFTAETWVLDEIIFTLSEETSGKIQIGMLAGAHNGPDDKAHVFFDDLQLEELALSADATLSSLSVNVGTMLQTFDAGTTDYMVLAPSGTTSVTVSASANDANAQGISGDGAIDVSGGSGSTTVTVTAEAGNTLSYNVTIYVNDATNLIDWWDGNGITGSESSPDIFGWGNSAGDAPWNDFNGSGGSRLRDNYSGYTYEDGGATVTGAQMMLRYDGSTASETSAFTYPVVLEANSVYEFSFDYVFGGSGSAPATLTAGVGASTDASTEIASQGYETASNTTSYRSGNLVFMTQEAGIYYVKFKSSKRCWLGVNTLAVTASDFIGWNGVWSNSTGPANGDNILVDAVLDYTGDGVVNDLIVGSNGSLIIFSGASLAIMGEASGNATIMRNSTGNAGYSIVGAPVVNNELLNLGADYIYDWDEVNGVWSDNLNASVNVLTPGKGYFVGYDAATPTISLTGALVSGNLSTAITSGGTDNGDGSGWNLVANPYAAAISSDDVIANTNNATSTDGSLYLWVDGDANNGADRAGSYVVANSGNSVDVGSFQGFFINSTTGGTVDFTPDMQVTTAGSNADGNFYRKATSELQKLKLTLTGNGLYNEVAISFDETATYDKDYGWDAKYLQGSDLIAFYTLLDGQRFATQGLPKYQNEPIEVELGMDLNEAGDYKVSVAQFQQFGQLSVILIDNETGETHELSNGVEVPFTTGEVVDAKRFKVVVAPAKVLAKEYLTSGLKVYGGVSELTIDYASNKEELVKIYSLDGRSVFSQQVTFTKNQAVIAPQLNRQQVYVLKVNDQSVKFVLK